MYETATPFRDNSPVQDWIEFYTAHGTVVRAERRGNGIFGVYTLSDGAYIHRGIVSVSGRPSPRSIWNAYLDLEDDF